MRMYQVYAWIMLIRHHDWETGCCVYKDTGDTVRKPWRMVPPRGLMKRGRRKLS